VASCACAGVLREDKHLVVGVILETVTVADVGSACLDVEMVAIDDDSGGDG